MNEHATSFRTFVALAVALAAACGVPQEHRQGEGDSGSQRADASAPDSGGDDGQDAAGVGAADIGHEPSPDTGGRADAAGPVDEDARPSADAHDDAATTPLCGAGATRCDGTAVLACAAGGLGWTFVEDCATECAAGACLSALCEPAARRCAGPDLEECDVRGLRWQLVRSCADGCEEAACQPPPEVPPACPAQARRCVGDAVELCDPSTGWTTLEVCALGCAAGACREPVCEAGARRCAGDEIDVCTEDGLGWRFRRACPTACRDGACLDPLCVPFSRSCQDLVPRSCDARGLAWVDGPACLATCRDGVCDEAPPGACRVGGARCVGRTREVCSAAGAWEVVEECARTCVQGACAACVPGSRRCGDGDVEVCADDGETWVLEEACALGCSDAACRACAGGDRRCAGDDIETCTADGLGWAFVSTCESACREGACTACRPLEIRCNADAVELCVDEGIGWELLEECPGRCADGSCVCDPNATEEQNNGVDDDCDGEVDEPPTLAVVGFVVADDGWAGEERPATYGGADNRLLDAGERVRLHVRLKNEVGHRLLGGDARLGSETDGVAVLRQAEFAEYPVLEAGASALLEAAFEVELDAALADGQALTFLVRYTDSLLGELPPVRFSTVVHAVPPFLPEELVVDDDFVGFSEGDNDLLGDPGEQIELRFALRAPVGLPLLPPADDPNERALPGPPHQLRVAAEPLVAWVDLRGPDVEQTWREAAADQVLAPPATFFLALADDAPVGGLSCVRLVQTVEGDGETLYRFEVPTCFRIGQPCPAEDGDGDGVPCLFGDCVDDDPELLFAEEERACDGIDEDCDGQVDDPWGVGQECDGRGICLDGHLECDGPDGVRCDVAPGGSADRSEPEVCDDVDNDCDGAVDEDDGAGGQCGEQPIDTYVGGGQTIYKMARRPLPPGNAARWYQAICEDAGLRPVCCDWDQWGASYDAREYNAVRLDRQHYGCNVSSGIMGLTGWSNVITYHRPCCDDRNVCERGCTITGEEIYPICTD